MRKVLILFAGIACLFIFAPSTASAECAMCGDLTADGAVDIMDITAFIKWYFQWPSITPSCPCAADVNCDNAVTVNIYDPYDTSTDLGYLIASIWYDGPPPCDPDDDGQPNCDHCD